MHTTDGSSCKCASDSNSPPGDLFVGSDGDKGGKKYQYGHEEGQGSEATGVGNLQLRVSVTDIDCSVSDIMHTPNGDTTHSYGCSDEQQASQFVSHLLDTPLAKS